MTRPRLLDLTRSLRRAGRTATGVDRVELAYLARFLFRDAPVFGLVRTPLGYLLLDKAALADFEEKIRGKRPFGAASLLSRLADSRDDAIKRAESDLRQRAIARIRRGRLAAVLKTRLPGGFDYYNVGHSNLTHRVLTSVVAAGGRINVLVHDMIPLEYPELQRDGSVEPFEAKMRRVSAQADRVIYNSHATRDSAERFFRDWGRVPDAIVAHLGTVKPKPDPKGLPAGLPPAQPYFVTVGTIEPRKNHRFLLDIWEALGGDAPPLLICGRRGWKNEDVFARLDALPPGGPIREVAGLDDPALAFLVGRSAGMLFPSVAEGFGLPPVEAMLLGTRVLCNDLPVLHEFLGAKAVYASVDDHYRWTRTVTSWAKEPPDAPKNQNFSAPTWENHFKTVLSLQ